MTSSQRMDALIRRVSVWTGTTGALMTALLVILAWALSGPVLNYSDTWQLLINTGTSVVTFLMVFVIQRSQIRDTTAIQLKLNELIAAVEGASNRMIGIENLKDEEILKVRQGFDRLAEMSKRESSQGNSHTVEEIVEYISRAELTENPDDREPTHSSHEATQTTESMPSAKPR